MSRRYVYCLMLIKNQNGYVSMKKIINLLFVSFFLKVFAGEIIIQNGLNGYSGCYDTYITQPNKGGDESNHGIEPIIRLRAGG